MVLKKSQTSICGLVNKILSPTNMIIEINYYSELYPRNPGLVFKKYFVANWEEKLTNAFHVNRLQFVAIRNVCGKPT